MRRADLKIAGVVAGVAAALFLIDVSRAEEGGVVEANAGDVVINEIMWMGSNAVSDVDEWIELRNTTGDVIDLAGWSIGGLGTGADPVVTIPGGTIPAGGYFLIGNYASSSSAISDAVTSDLVTTGVSLANGGEQLTLKDAYGNEIDATPAGAWEEGNNNISPADQRNSMERNDVPGTGAAWSDWHTCLDDGCNDGVFWDVEEGNDYGTPMSSGISSVLPVPASPSPSPAEEEGSEGDEQQYSDEIIINEFLPNPKGSDTEGEFIELKNTGSEEVSLAGWRLDDGEGGSSPYKIPAGVSLPGGGYYVFWRPDTKLALNNDGDWLRLFDPAGNIKSSFVYEESVAEAASYNRTDSGEYVLSATVTPGGDNVITEPAPEDDEGGSDKSGGGAGAAVTKVLLKDIRGQAVGTVVETEGVVSVPPGVLGDKIMYIAGSGIQVYFYQEEYPELEVGDKVKVKGELATSLGETRIKLARAEDVVAIGEEAAPEPHRAATGEVGKSLEGSLVVVAGRVTRTSGDTFYIDDGSGEIKVFIKATTGIDKPKMKKGAVVTIAGVVSRTNTGYRILPRWQQDVRLGLVAGLASFPGAGWPTSSAGRPPGPFGTAGLVAVLALALARRAGEPLLGKFNTKC